MNLIVFRQQRVQKYRSQTLHLQYLSGRHHISTIKSFSFWTLIFQCVHLLHWDWICYQFWSFCIEANVSCFCSWKTIREMIFDCSEICAIHVVTYLGLGTFMNCSCWPTSLVALTRITNALTKQDHSSWHFSKIFTSFSWRNCCQMNWDFVSFPKNYCFPTAELISLLFPLDCWSANWGLN